MIYDLLNPLHRKQFTARCNRMLAKHCRAVELVDAEQRTPNQNAYLHVLCRILAIEVGVDEAYAKLEYFKKRANRDMFYIGTFTDKLTGEVQERYRSSSLLSVEEMSKAINRFRKWSEDQGYYLPEADIDDTGHVHFKTEKDAEAYRQAVVETGRQSNNI